MKRHVTRKTSDTRLHLFSTIFSNDHKRALGAWKILVKWRDRDKPNLILTLWSFEMNNGIVVFEHVHFFNITERLHAYTPNFVTMDSTANARTYRIFLLRPSASCLLQWIVIGCELPSSFSSEYLNRHVRISRRAERLCRCHLPFPPICVGFPNFAASLARASATSWSILF